MIMAPLAGRLVERIHAGILGGIGMVIFATGLFLLAVLPSNPTNVILYGGCSFVIRFRIIPDTQQQYYHLLRSIQP